jgi:hypothetical protein
MIGNYNTQRLDKMIKSLHLKETTNAPAFHKPKLYRGKQHEQIKTPALDRLLK